MKKHIFIIFLSLSAASLQAQIQLSDSARISLMTTSPWDGAAYALYGHTALYVEDDSTGLDAVFNYGFFDTSKPNFTYNFMKGKTDYVLGVTSFEDFISEYRQKGVEAIKQELNLTQEEKQKIWEALYINSLPENREYRYNFLYDNCVTRPRDLIEKFTEGKISYPEDREVQTYRDLIHACVGIYPWMKFGIDLIIGNGADKPISLREKMFLPEYLMNALDETTVIKNDSLAYPIVSDRIAVLRKVNKPQNKSEWYMLSPIVAAFALLFVTVFVSVIQYIQWNKTKLPVLYDTFLFALMGSGGVVIFFLMYFSEHPVTCPNWNFVWMNIFALVFAALFWVKPMKSVVNIYHLINFAVLTLFLLFWWLIPQQMPLATIPFSMSLWLRSGMNAWMLTRRKITNKRYVSSKYMKAGWGATHF